MLELCYNYDILLKRRKAFLVLEIINVIVRLPFPSRFYHASASSAKVRIFSKTRLQINEPLRTSCLYYFFVLFSVFRK